MQVWQRLPFLALFLVCACSSRLRPWLLRHNQAYLTALVLVRLLGTDMLVEMITWRSLGHPFGLVTVKHCVGMAMGVVAGYLSGMPLPLLRNLLPLYALRLALLPALARIAHHAGWSTAAAVCGLQLPTAGVLINVRLFLPKTSDSILTKPHLAHFAGAGGCGRFRHQHALPQRASTAARVGCTLSSQQQEEAESCLISAMTLVRLLGGTRW